MNALTDWQMESAFDEGYNAALDGANEEFSNPYWRTEDLSREWLKGFVYASQDEIAMRNLDISF